MPKLNLSKAKRNELKLDYLENVLKITSKKYVKPKNAENIFWDSSLFQEKNIELELFNKRVNINENKRLLETGVDYTQLLIPISDPDAIYDKRLLAHIFFDSAIIFIGTVIDSTHTIKTKMRDLYGIKKELTYHYANYKIKIDNLIKGKYMVDDFPSEIVIHNEYGLDTYTRDIYAYRHYVETILNEEFIMFNFQKFEEGEKVIILIPFNERKRVVNEILEGHTDLLGTNILSFERLKRSVADENYMNKNKIKVSGDLQKDMNNIIDFMIKLEDINDTPNFFNRSYK